MQPREVKVNPWAETTSISSPLRVCLFSSYALDGGDVIGEVNQKETRRDETWPIRRKQARMFINSDRRAYIVLSRWIAHYQRG